jgi:hypothetical protein
MKTIFDCVAATEVFAEVDGRTPARHPPHFRLRCASPVGRDRSDATGCSVAATRRIATGFALQARNVSDGIVCDDDVVWYP